MRFGDDRKGMKVISRQLDELKAQGVETLIAAAAAAAPAPAARGAGGRGRGRVAAAAPAAAQ
jgi:hypothetical protein